MTSSRMTPSVAALFALLALATPSIAKNDGPMQQGLAAEKAGRWQEAAEAFERAVAAKPSAEAKYHLALAEERLGRLVEALGHLEGAQEAALAEKARGVRAAAAKRAAELKKRIAKLTIQVDPKPGLVVTLDGKQVDAEMLGVPIEVNPGAHAVTAAYDEGDAAHRSVTLDEGADRSVELEPTRRTPAAAPADDHPTAAPASGSHTLAWVSLGVGAVGVVTGSVFALQAKQQRDELRAYCPSNECGPEAKGTLDTGERNAGVATGAFVVGGVGLALGAVLLLIDTSDDSTEAAGASIRPYVGLGSAGAIGRF